MQTNLRNNRLPLAIIMLKVTLLIPHKKHHQHRKRLTVNIKLKLQTYKQTGHYSQLEN